MCKWTKTKISVALLCLVVGDGWGWGGHGGPPLQGCPEVLYISTSDSLHTLPASDKAGGDSDPSPLLRIAVVGFTGDNGPAITAALRNALAADDRVSSIEPEQIKPALAGVGYSGSINMTLEEARRLGAAIGCDFFIVGKAEALTRSEKKMEAHGEGIIGVFIVDGRSGRLALFRFICEKAPAANTALERATTALAGSGRDFIDKMEQYQKQRTSGPAGAGTEKGRSPDPVEDIPDAGSPKSVGFVPPQFLNRVKPAYTPDADLAGINATVEALAVFKANGEVGEIEITRWAGYGLDESAEQAIRGLKFKPAARGGRAISVRAMIRYNFKVSSPWSFVRGHLSVSVAQWSVV